MARWVLLVCLVVGVCGCGGDQVADARTQAHGLAASDLLVLESLERGDISPRFAQEHLRASRKNLQDIRKPLKEARTAAAAQLEGTLEKTDQLLERLAGQPDSRTGVAQLQQIEVELREGGR